MKFVDWNKIFNLDFDNSTCLHFTLGISLLLCLLIQIYWGLSAILRNKMSQKPFKKKHKDFILQFSLFSHFLLGLRNYFIFLE